MSQEDSIANGFFLALTLLDSLEVRYDRDAVLQRLSELAAGDVSAFNSSAEDLAAMEKRRGVPASEQERAEFEELKKSRRAMDVSNQVAAMQVLQALKREGFV
jgi:hypothetical protein